MISLKKKNTSDKKKYFFLLLAVFMNSAFVGNAKENLQNLVVALIAELGETVFKSGTLRANFYEDEIPRFTRGKNLSY